MKNINIHLILGVVCFVIAVGLTYANLTLPPESLMFMVGDRNMPWLSPIILVVVGIVLLAIAGIGRSAEAVSETPAVVHDPEKAALNKRLENITWGCFLILWGGSMFWGTIAPNNPIREGLWSIAVGLILLGLNVARYLKQIKMSGFTTVLGVISIVGGIVQLFGVKGLEGAFLLIILGAFLILKPWFDRRQLFGKAEEK